MINSSAIDLTSVPWLPLEEKSAFPKRPTIYFAINSLGNVQYIGRAIHKECYPEEFSNPYKHSTGA